MFGVWIRRANACGFRKRAILESEERLSEGQTLTLVTPISSSWPRFQLKTDTLNSAASIACRAVHQPRQPPFKPQSFCNAGCPAMSFASTWSGARVLTASSTGKRMSFSRKSGCSVRRTVAVRATIACFDVPSSESTT
eukprot:3011837-Rhodomonas_salina.2